MGINLTCPQCGQRMAFDLASTTVMCKHCGFTRGSGLDDRAAQIRAKGQRPNISLTYKGEVNMRALALFNTGHDYLWQEDKPAAIRAFEEALDIQPDFLDAHLWIAKTSDDEQIKRDHLGSILAYDAGHPEATRMMMVLNGRLTPEQAARSASSEGPILMRAEMPVGIKATTLQCPVCRGDLTVNDVTGQVECRFCGYAGDKPAHQFAESDSFTAAMMERKAQAVKWVIGERLLHCNECGAERTIAATELSTRCPFCNSNQVIEQDALASFEQPQAIIPFKITREQAGAAIKEQLKSMSERLKGLFDNNKVTRATLNGYYLPFWMFDAMVDVNRTRIDTRPAKDRVRAVADAYTQVTFNDALYDVEVCAVKSPAESLTSRLGDYNTRESAAYAPEMLAKYPAQVYSIDFDQAALQARGWISTQMRDKYTLHDMSDSKEVSVHVFTNVRQMSFRLMLAPVWIGTLVEADGDIRSVLVNGQTGKVVLSKAEKPRR
jgi:Zn finger protein HypA/HybF involved in hydrogenase expression